MAAAPAPMKPTSRTTRQVHRMKRPHRRPGLVAPFPRRRRAIRCYYTEVKTGGASMGFWEDLAWRGLIADSTKPDELREHLRRGSRTAYVGFDPTADSLHIGS